MRWRAHTQTHILHVSSRLLQNALRVIDLVFKESLKGRFESVGRNAVFDHKPLDEINEKLLAIHRGYLTLARTQWKVRLIVDLVRVMCVWSFGALDGRTDVCCLGNRGSSVPIGFSFHVLVFSRMFQPSLPELIIA